MLRKLLILTSLLWLSALGAFAFPSCRETCINLTWVKGTNNGVVYCFEHTGAQAAVIWTNEDSDGNLAVNDPPGYENVVKTWVNGTACVKQCPGEDPSAADRFQPADSGPDFYYPQSKCVNGGGGNYEM